jgi:hypothetical protein
MLHRFRDRFSTAGLVVAVVALVAALGGTALAAKGALTGKQKKEVTKIAKKYAGQPGAPGAAGTNGTNGTNGKDGAPGERGPQGEPGTNGTNGKSIIAEAEATGTGNCDGEGGASFHQEGSAIKTYACNGQTGFTEVLPSGKTETGAWAAGVEPGGTAGAVQRVPVGFNIPLAAPPTETVYNEPEGSKCPGTFEEPEATAGVLCVYVDLSENAFYLGASARRYTSGGVLPIALGAEGSFAEGTWAVTAP